LDFSSLRFRLLWKDFVIVSGLSLIYLTSAFWLIGFKSDQLMLVVVFSGLYLASSITRKFVLGFSVFIAFWIIFDYMKAFPNYLFQEVSTKGLYETELYWFGIKGNGSFITLCDYFSRHHWVWADVLAGLFYLCWIPVPLGFAAFLFFKNRQEFLYFALTFLLTNLLGFVVYYTYPAAPPWYVQLHGFDFKPATPGNTAGLIRFDEFFGITLFQQLYSKSSNIFAAMPSLHSAYPLLVTVFGFRNKLGSINVVFSIITIGIWMAAVYSSHHYVLDVLAGIGMAVLGIALFFAMMKKSNFFSRFVQRYVQAIS
jgi:hypothetical protein